MRDSFDAMLMTSAKALGIRLLRNEEGQLLAPLQVIAHALGTTEDALVARLKNRGVQFVTATDMKMSELQ